MALMQESDWVEALWQEKDARLESARGAAG